MSNILKLLPLEMPFPGNSFWSVCMKHIVLMHSGPILLPEPENDAFCFIKIKPKQWLAFGEMIYSKIDTSSSSSFILKTSPSSSLN